MPLVSGLQTHDGVLVPGLPLVLVQDIADARRKEAEEHQQVAGVDRAVKPPAGGCCFRGTAHHHTFPATNPAPKPTARPSKRPFQRSAFMAAIWASMASRRAVLDLASAS